MFNDHTRARAISLTCQIVYAVAALVNLAIFLYWRGDLNNLSIVLLLTALIGNQRVIDLWRQSALGWRDAATSWQDSAATWRDMAERR